MNAKVIVPVIVQHAAEVPILLRMRRDMQRSTEADLDDLAALDAQISANLEGLMLAGSVGWDHALERFEDDPDADTVAALAYLANVGDRRARVPVLMAALAEDADLMRGAALGLCWHGRAAVHDLALRLLGGPSPQHQALGLACCLLIGVYPAEAIATGLDGPPAVRVWALRLAGWGNVSAVAGQIAQARDDDDADCALARAVAAAMMVAPVDYLARLKHAAAAMDAGGALARMVLGVAISDQDLADWVASEEGPASPDQKIEVAGYAGHPARIGWLLDCAGHDSFAEIAEASIARITGVDLSARFEDDLPPVAADPFATDAPPPLRSKAQKVAEWWDKAERELANGPYLNGQAVATIDWAEAQKAAALGDRPLIALRARITFGVVPGFQCEAPAFVQRV
ncbi:hypothetical protein AB3Y40_01015 [Yoonia sp. R2331]|uniref:hypothetical protein n=1 Tax=Yoonia sp. R2331 TaxID=3237238 RepID=UPI0034E5B710